MGAHLLYGKIGVCVTAFWVLFLTKHGDQWPLYCHGLAWLLWVGSLFCCIWCYIWLEIADVLLDGTLQKSFFWQMIFA